MQPLRSLSLGGWEELDEAEKGEKAEGGKEEGMEGVATAVAEVAAAAAAAAAFFVEKEKRGCAIGAAKRRGSKRGGVSRKRSKCV